MSDTEEFYRIKKLPPYVFEEVNALKASLRLLEEDQRFAVVVFETGVRNLSTTPRLVPGRRRRRTRTDRTLGSDSPTPYLTAVDGE